MYSCEVFILGDNLTWGGNEGEVWGEEESKKSKDDPTNGLK